MNADGRLRVLLQAIVRVHADLVLDGCGAVKHLLALRMVLAVDQLLVSVEEVPSVGHWVLVKSGNLFEFPSLLAHFFLIQNWLS